ncbi:type III-B CRISPR module-associated protein Cmr5 [Akkermansiaceae bacterium]|nr:type III-B CRISPR module-associated protein Cmr5 [Akkermansiaceae bacterium]
MLTNLEQLRAKNALCDIASKAKRDKEAGEGDVLSGYPSLIINNGLLATIAFAVYKGELHERIADVIAYHLNDRKIITAANAINLRKALTECDSSALRRATSETLAFLSYLKRFQK